MPSSGITSTGSVNRGKSVRLTATHASIAQVLVQFEHYAGRPLFDRTELTGVYDFEIAWDVDTLAPPAPDAADSGMIGQSFVTALEKQLGLKLLPATAAFDAIVIGRRRRTVKELVPTS